MQTKEKTHCREGRHITLMCACCIALMTLGAGLSPYRWNGSSSVPIGFYRVRHERPGAGALIAFCLPKPIALYAKARGYIHFGFTCPGWTQPLLKPVVAVAGDA